MGIFSYKKDIKALTQQISQLQNQSTFQMVNSSYALYPDWKVFENADRYSTTDDLYSIIKMLATTAALVPMWNYYVKADKPLKELKSLSCKAMPKLHKAFSIKALEDAPDTDVVTELLDNPCENMSKFEFLEAVYTMLFLQGECIIYKDKVELGVNAGTPLKLHFLYIQHVTIRVTQTYPQQILGYDYVVNGQKILSDIPPEDIIHIKYFNPNYSITGEELRGLSPLKALSKRLIRLDSEMNTSVAQLQNGGVPGIVYDKSDDGNMVSRDGKEVTIQGMRKDAFYRYISNQNTKGAPYFAAGEMGYIELGLKLADMEVAELSKIDFKKLCNAFGTSDILFNNDSASTESNVEEMTKRLYTNTILPNVFRVRDAFNNNLLPDFKDGKKRYINADISEIPELQENYKDLSTWLAAAWWVTPNEKREMMKFDKLNDTSFDMPLIPTGLQTLDDMQAINDIPLTNENGR